MSVAEVVLWPWQDTHPRTHIVPHQTALTPWVRSIGHQQSFLHLSASLCVSSSSFSLFFPCMVCCGDSCETQPHFPSYFPGKPKWKDTTNLFFLLAQCSQLMLTRDCSAISDLLQDSQNTHAHTIPITGSAFESAKSWLVWRNLMTHNVASILALPGQATRCTICPLFKGERGAWVALNQSDSKRVREWGTESGRIPFHYLIVNKYMIFMSFLLLNLQHSHQIPPLKSTVKPLKSPHLSPVPLLPLS